MARKFHAVIIFIAALTAAWLLPVSEVSAATIDEIVQMHESGISSDTIIAVIEATGLDEPLAISDLEFLNEVGIDSDILTYLAQYLPKENTEREYDENDEQAEKSNRAGGEGFHAGRGTDYDYNRYYGYDDYYSYRGNSDRNVIIYEPPVYFLNNDPYYHAYRAPRVWRTDPYYSHNGGISIYGDRYPYPVTVPMPWGYSDRSWRYGWRDYDYRHSYRWRDDYTRYGIRGGILFDGHGDDYDSFLDAWWRRNGVRLRISF
ncbi:MAG: hypothetical protein ABIC40_03525 [bacterium]